MTHLDFPFKDIMIGFDDFFNHASRLPASQKYPPYNIEKKSDTEYQIEVALAGWAEEQLDVEEHKGTLTVKGSKAEESDRDFIYKGIGSRAFTREFKLSDHIHVANASLDQGILTISLKAELPEELRPRKISVDTTSNRLLEAAA